MKFQIKNLNFTVNGRWILRDYERSFLPSLNLIHGMNGVGKTTFMKILAGQHEDSGTLIVSPATVSFLSLNSAGLLPFMEGKDLLSLISDIKKTFPVENELYRSQLFQICLSTRTEDFSNGMRQLFKYYLHSFWNPEVLLLDEPFTFLDSTNSRLIKEDLEQRRERAVIFVSAQAPEQLDMGFDYKLELTPHA